MCYRFANVHSCSRDSPRFSPCLGGILDTLLFDLPSGQSIALAGYAEYDVSRDGRSLVNVPVASPRPTALVTLNWKAGPKKWMNGSL